MPCCRKHSARRSIASVSPGSPSHSRCESAAGPPVQGAAPTKSYWSGQRPTRCEQARTFAPTVSATSFQCLMVTHGRAGTAAGAVVAVADTQQQEQGPLTSLGKLLLEGVVRCLNCLAQVNRGNGRRALRDALALVKTLLALPHALRTQRELKRLVDGPATTFRPTERRRSPSQT